MKILYKLQIKTTATLKWYVQVKTGQCYATFRSEAHTSLFITVPSLTYSTKFEVQFLKLTSSKALKGLHTFTFIW